MGTGCNRYMGGGAGRKDEITSGPLADLTGESHYGRKFSNILQGVEGWGGGG